MEQLLAVIIGVIWASIGILTYQVFIYVYDFTNLRWIDPKIRKERYETRKNHLLVKDIVMVLLSSILGLVWTLVTVIWLLVDISSSKELMNIYDKVMNFDLTKWRK